MFSIYNNGKPSPMGYSQTRENGLKFRILRCFLVADAVELCLFRDGKESRFAMSRTDDIWHVVAIEGVELNDEYAFRITGKMTALWPIRKVNA